MIFFFTDTAPTEIYTLSLHDALPISHLRLPRRRAAARRHGGGAAPQGGVRRGGSPLRGTSPVRRKVGGRSRSEEHTSELQSQSNLVCRLLLEKKKKI